MWWYRFREGKADIFDELVFPSESGTAIEMNNFSERVFKPLLAALCGRVEWGAE